jgi:hypothetical protein
MIMSGLGFAGANLASRPGCPGADHIPVRGVISSNGDSQAANELIPQ